MTEKKQQVEIKIKKIDPNLPDFEKLEIGDWIDLRITGIKKAFYPNMMTREYDFKGDIKGGKIKLKKDFVYFFSLGFACEIPKGYEAYILPRGSTYKNSGLILLNNMGIVDESYCGNDDQWMAVCKADFSTEIENNSRLFQFRIQEKMPKIKFKYVKDLKNKNRDGFGSTGVK